MRILLLLVLLLISERICVLAQIGEKTIHREDDGFEWVEIVESGQNSAVAKHTDGRVIVGPELKIDYIRYRISEDGPFSVGCFLLEKYKDKKIFNTICDLNGNVLLPFKYRDVHLYVKIISGDTLAYLSASNSMQTSDIYALNGKRIAADVKNYDVDNTGNFYDWETKKSLGFRMPVANGLLSNFYLKKEKEKVQTSLGIYSVLEKENEGFNWKFLYTDELCGAQTNEGKVIVPVEKKCKEITYNSGVFICRTIDNVCCVYSKEGKEIVSTSLNYQSISVDTYTKTYLCCHAKDIDGIDNDVSLHDLNGKIIFATGTYSYINPKRVKDKVYFIVSKNSESIVLDSAKNILAVVDNPCFFTDIHEDCHGKYYKILRHNDERNSGIIDENGRVVIAPGCYDLIERIANDSIAFYITTIIQGKQSGNKQYLHGVCDIDGNEVLTNEYSYISSIGENILYLKKGSLAYKVDIVQKIAKAKEQRNRRNDLTNRNSAEQKVNEQNAQERNEVTYSSLGNGAASMKNRTLTDTNFVDNSEKISCVQQHIVHLDTQKKTCKLCHGKGATFVNCPVCLGTGYKKIGYITPEYYVCGFCQGGKRKEQCAICTQTDMEIVMSQNMLKILQDTHGMTKEEAAAYHEIKAWENKNNLEWKRTVQEITDSYLSNTSTKLNQSKSLVTKCSMCNGTGIDTVAFDLTYITTGLTVGYTNVEGNVCPYCKRVGGHKHVYCPKCKAEKHR